MNPYRIYRDEWANALRLQAIAAEYTSFVAMPFYEHFSYRSQEILCEVITAAIEEANRRGGLPRQFSSPQRGDTPKGAVVITEAIVLQILQSHIFIGDLTFQNAGVVLETGVAMGMKPIRQIVLITQGSLEELHFDLRNNKIVSYNPKGSVSEIADALIAAASHFEEQVQHYLTAVTRRLSPEAIAALKWYGTIQKKNKFFSLHSKSRGPHFSDEEGLQRFQLAIGELLSKDLLWTHLAVGAIPDGDAFGMHATEFGWAVIEKMWPEFRQEGRVEAHNPGHQADG